jgi:hypothetical protein
MSISSSDAYVAEFYKLSDFYNPNRGEPMKRVFIAAVRAFVDGRRGI